MSIITIILFFVYTLGLGYSVIKFFKLDLKGFEKYVIMCGIGLVLIAPIAILLNLIRLPIHWIIFFILSLMIPVYFLIKDRKKIKDNFKFNFKLTKSSICLIFVFLLFFFVFFMYAKGAFSYHWLGDGDPWIHTTSVKYIASERTVFIEEGTEETFRYLDPYPPGYGVFLGLMHQTSNEIIWTMKFFNILTISLGLLFFYFFLKKFLKSSTKALFSTFILAMVPAFVSRFIWAHSLVIAILPIFLYALISIKENKKWAYVAGIVLGSSALIQPTQPIKFGVMFLIIAGVTLFTNKKLWKQYLIVLGIAAVVSLLWWGPMFVKYGNPVDMFFGERGDQGIVFEGQGSQTSNTFIGPLGSATRMYYFNDFFMAKSQNLITNPVGWGIVISLLFAIGLIATLFNYKSLNPKKQTVPLITLLLFVFTFAGLFGGTVLPIALFSFRFWTLVCIPLAIIATEGLWFLFKFGKKVGVPLFIILLIVLPLVFATSGYQKYKLNTVQWAPDNAMIKYGQFDSYTFLDSLPKDTKVYYFCHRRKFGDHEVLAYDMDACPWCEEVIQFRSEVYNESGFNISASDIKSWLDKNNYEYLMIEGNCIDMLMPDIRDNYGIERDIAMDLATKSTTDLFNELDSSDLFVSVHKTKGSIIFR